MVIRGRSGMGEVGRKVQIDNRGKRTSEVGSGRFGVGSGGTRVRIGWN